MADIDDLIGTDLPREWLVIESAYKHAVFAEDETRNRKGYIPRDVAEPLLGRKIATGTDVEWFSREEGEKMRAHPEWRDNLEEHRDHPPANRSGE